MLLDLPQLTFSGPPIDDPATLTRLPSLLAAALRGRNGVIAYGGGLHVRGACREPAWHSLRAAWEGPNAFHALYPGVQSTDIPFAEDAFGDQFLVRAGAVVRLEAEWGGIVEVSVSVERFFASLVADANSVLGFDPRQVLAALAAPLAPGQLVQAFPPFVLKTEAKVQLHPVLTDQLRRSLAILADELRGLPDGKSVRVRVPD